MSAVELTPETIKPVVARLRIYSSATVLHARVRVAAASIPCASLRALADLMDPVGARAHLTTRRTP
jgi:hypothetical protein